MKKFLTLACLIASAHFASAQISQNINLVSNWSDPAVPAEPAYQAKYSGCWGWTAPDGKEYAIIGATSGTYFIDISNPSLPVMRDFVPGRRGNCLWREFKTYQNYCYMVSDDSPPNSLQIVDLSYLPDSVHIVHDDNTIFERAHTIYVDGDKLYAGSVTKPNNAYYGMAVYSLANPASPTLLRHIAQDYPSMGTVHDMFVRNDTVYASAGYSGLYIYEFDAAAGFNMLQSMTTYPEQGYNHSSFLTADGRTLIMADEVPDGLAMKVVDVSDLSNISVTTTFRSNPGATPHNPYNIGNNRTVIAYYMDGIQIFDISNPANPVRTGYYDTYPNNGSSYPTPAYKGAWGAYVDFPSGNIIASDMQTGLYVLDAGVALGVKDAHPNVLQAYVFPNPVGSSINLSITLKQPQTLKFEITDVAGRVVMSTNRSLNAGTNDVIFNSSLLAKGVYFLKAQGDDVVYTEKLIKN